MNAKTLTVVIMLVDFYTSGLGGFDWLSAKTIRHVLLILETSEALTTSFENTKLLKKGVAKSISYVSTLLLINSF